MKKTCRGCRALSLVNCSLGYKVKRVWGKGIMAGIEDDPKPLEECPKPLTNKKYMDLF